MKKSDQTVLLELIAGLTFAEGMGDVCNEVASALKRLGIRFKWHTLEELRAKLAERGVTHWDGTALMGEEGDE